MKIDTLEKLEILMFGLNAGRGLDIQIESGAEGYLFLGNFEGLGFHIDNSGKIKEWICTGDELDLWTLEGCLSNSTKEAKDWFKHIKAKELTA
mgnify:FL=1|jgi:hypothetical protein|tara:strand:- start:913 stop:1191 length:279 start_codon:yes stop_codon:yes gene_type:complete